MYGDAGIRITGGTISDNLAVDGGGVYLPSSGATLEDTMISANTASAEGGGVYAVSSGTLDGATITGNTAQTGGGMYLQSAANAFQHVWISQGFATIDGNSASLRGGGVAMETGVTADAFIVTNNTAPEGAGFVVRGGAGWGWANFTEVELSDTEEQGHGDRTTEWGFGWELNVGYEWRLVKNMSAGLGIGVNHLDIGGDLTDTATFYPVTLNMGWYWD